MRFPGPGFRRHERRLSPPPGDPRLLLLRKDRRPNKTSLCTITEAFWAPYTPSLYTVISSEAEKSDYWYFRVSADRFLRNMVRAIVGTLIEVGRGKHDPAWVKELIETGTRGDAGESVPGHALFLSKVRY